MEILAYTATFAMGITLGLMGGGGSILTVPILVYLLGLSPEIATGYSLFVVGVTAFVGSLIYLRKDEIDFKVGLLFAIPSMIGVIISRAFVVPGLPGIILNFAGITITKEVFILGVFAALMIAAALSMVAKREVRPPFELRKRTRTAVLAVEGLLIGLVAGFVGAGGGFLIIPALVHFAGLSMRLAVGTSLAIIAVQSLTGFGGDILRGATADWRLLGVVAIVSVCGIAAGSALAHRIKERNLKIAFGWFVLILGTFILIDQGRRLS